jgi:ABC-2 type transport system permease protein
VLSFLAVSGLSLLLWRSVNLSGAELPLPGNELLSYLLLAFVVFFGMEFGINNSLTQGLRTGTIAMDMLRPIPLTWLNFCNSAAWGTIQVFYAALALLVLWPFLPELPLPGDALRWGAFLLSLGLAVFLQFSIIFLFSQQAFISHSTGYGSLYMRLMLHQVFSGAFAPISFFPEGLKSVALLLPFRHVVDTPVRIALDMAPYSEVPGMLLNQLLWGLGIFALGQLIFKALLGRTQIQGG